jgi:hypothetical protein
MHEGQLWSKLTSNQSAAAAHCKGQSYIYSGGKAALNLSWNRAGGLMTTVVAVIFGVFAIGLIVLLIYKSTLTMHRDDQLFLDDASSHMHNEQTELLTKVNRLTIPVRVFAIWSGVFLLGVVAMWLYEKLNMIQ